MKAILRFLYRNKEKVLPGVELKRIPPFGWLRSTIRKRMKRDFVEIDGHKIFLDPRDALDLSIDPNYEPESVELVRSKAKPGDVAIDIGAHIGYYSLILAKCVGTSGRVFAFEPDPANFSILQKNLGMNGYGNVVAVNKAVSDKAITAKLYLAEDNLGDHRVFDSGDGRQSIPIEMVTLDDFLKEPPVSVNVVKMDVQGAECQVLRGMRSVLTRSERVTLFSEFWPYGLRAAGDDPNEYISLLNDLGFTIYDVCSPLKRLSREFWTSYLRRSQGDNPQHLDLMCVRH